MIFEKQDYQQECITNIITLLDGFDFKRHDALNLKDCLSQFHAAFTPHAFTPHAKFLSKI